MTAFNRGWILLAMGLFVVALVAGSCSGGDDELDLNQPRPSISSVVPSTVNPGDTVTISGINFGETQSSGSVSLNGQSLSITNWSDTQIQALVPATATSGIIIVEVSGLESQSGTQAKVNIGQAPIGSPILNAVSPDFGRKGTDEVLFVGQNFGPAPGRVLFTGAQQASGASQANQVLIEAKIVEVTIGNTNQFQWSPASIKAIVPADAVTGPVYVEVDGVLSNARDFTVLPADQPLGAPVITELDPPNGGIGTTVTVNGMNFNTLQGTSNVTIGGLVMNVLSWSDKSIKVEIPVGAQDNPISVTVNGQTALSSDFIVANMPMISGVSPAQFKIGQSMSIFGSNFGFEQGDGEVTIGSTTVSPSTWVDNKITIDVIPSINFSDQTMIPLVVTNDAGLSSATFNAELISDLKANANVSPTAGEAGTTLFTFSVSVAGGSGNYEYELIPDANTGVVEETSTNASIGYTYPGNLETTTFNAQVRIRDTDTNDTTVVDVPASIFVVKQGEPVITQMSVQDFNRGGTDAPNDICYTLNLDTFEEDYHQFTFSGGETFFHSIYSSVFSGPIAIDGTQRDLSAFMSGGSKARGNGYRYAGGNGSIVRVSGLNFGDTAGSIWMNSNAPGNGTQIANLDIVEWADDHVDFRIPFDPTKALSGLVTLENLDGFSATSNQPLVCSPYITGVSPDPVQTGGNLTLTGFDLLPPVIPGRTGTSTFAIVEMTANYVNPFTGLAENQNRLAVLPVEIDPIGTTVNIPLNALQPFTSVEVFNLTGDDAQIVENGTPVAGAWRVFLWTGAITSGSNTVRADSGIFSEAFNINATMGP